MEGRREKDESKIIEAEAGSKKWYASNHMTFLYECRMVCVCVCVWFGGNDCH